MISVMPRFFLPRAEGGLIRAGKTAGIPERTYGGGEKKMLILGFQKLTLLDYPEHTACTVFTGGCNLRCPFCHNALLVTDIEADEAMEEEEIFAFLEKRKKLLDGVAVTGGEPLLQKGLEEFLRKVKAMGYAVKLDTNGFFPDRLKAIVEEGLADYVAVDIKNTPEKYEETTGISGLDLSPLEKTIAFLKEDHVPYEFRTTVVREFHEVKDFDVMGAWIGKARRWYLQKFVDSGYLIGENLSAPPKAELLQMLEIARKYADIAELRGVD